MKELRLKRKDGKLITGYIKLLDESYIDKIVELQHEIIEGLENKDLYADSGRENFLISLRGFGKVIGCVTEDDELIALGVYANYKDDKENYGYDMNLNKEEILKVGQIESTVVRKPYRGNGLQRIICEIIEEISRKNGDKIIGATVAPENLYSLNNFIKEGYEIVIEKIKYGNYRRYILKKVL